MNRMTVDYGQQDRVKPRKDKGSTVIALMIAAVVGLLIWAISSLFH